MEIEENRSYLVFFVGFFLILTLPLLILHPWFFPPDWGKTIVFRIIFSSMILFFIWQILKSGKFSIKTTLAFWFLILLFLVFLLATLFSIDKNFSFWGDPHRAGGFLNFSFYIIFAVLAFLIIRKRDWKKIWDFSIIIGILVSIIAVLQYFHVLSQTLIPYERNPPSTLGNSAFLAIYLSFLVFLALSFGLKEKKYIKKFFYFLTIFLFIFVILITETRAVYLGLVAGFLYFILFYPKKLFWLKIVVTIFLALSILAIYYLNTRPQLPEFIKNSRTLTLIASRLSFKLLLKEARFSAWKVSLEAIKERPILGWGLENFSIGFDKYYDPAFPELIDIWWDRAHNFVFDIGVTAGIPALIIYLSLFGVLFWQLQKLKKDPEEIVICHGIQATFLAYLVANFLSFDTFSSYLISFLLIGYSLNLISKDIPEQTFSFNVKGKKIIILLLSVGLIWFIWAFNIKPLQLNKEVRIALYQVREGDYQGALVRLESLFKSHSFLDNYIGLNYIEIANEYIEKAPKSTQELLAQKAIQILKENVKVRPSYTRNWILLGNYTNVLIEKGQKSLKDEANYYFERANELSPKRQEVFYGWSKTDFLTGDYPGAKKKAQKCVELNPDFGKCWWLMGLSNIHLGEKEEAQENINIASQKGYYIYSENALLLLAEAYTDAKDYQRLIGIYKELTSIKTSNAQYHAFLAAAYKEIGDYKNAKEEILKALELMPEAKEQIEEFLRELK